MERGAVRRADERRRISREIAAGVWVEPDLRHEPLIGRAAADRVAGCRVHGPHRDREVVGRRLAAHDDRVPAHVGDLRHRLQVVRNAAAATEERLIHVLRRVGAQTAEEAGARRARAIRRPVEGAARRHHVIGRRRAGHNRFARAVHGQSGDAIGVMVCGPDERRTADGGEPEARDDAGLDIRKQRREGRVRRANHAGRDRVVVRPAAPCKRHQFGVDRIDRREPQVVLARAADERRILEIRGAGAVEFEPRDRRVLRSVPDPVECVRRGDEDLDVVAGHPAAHGDEAIRVNDQVLEDVGLRATEERAVGERRAVRGETRDEHVALSASIGRRVGRVVRRMEGRRRRREIARNSRAADDDVTSRIVRHRVRVVVAGTAEEGRKNQTACGVQANDEGILVDPDPVEHAGRRWKVRREGLSHQHGVAGCVHGEPPMNDLRVPAADEGGIAERGSGRVEACDECGNLTPRCERRDREHREVGRCHGAADQHVASSVASHDGGTDEIRT